MASLLVLSDVLAMCLGNLRGIQDGALRILDLLSVGLLVGPFMLALALHSNASSLPACAPAAIVSRSASRK